MSAYRFCRTDDIDLLVAALNRCWQPFEPGAPTVTPAAFKEAIRDVQVWCSSCMVAFSGADPIGVLIGAKRHGGTLVHRLAVHPDHRRQGHGRHLLESLASKLAILGPPTLIAEVPAGAAAAGALFRSAGYGPDTQLHDYVWEGPIAPHDDPHAAVDIIPGRFIIPVTMADLEANGVLDDVQAHACWERAPEAWATRTDEVTGLAIASDERIEACLLASRDGRIVALRSLVEDGGLRVRLLAARLVAEQGRPARFAKVDPREIEPPTLLAAGFRRGDAYVRYTARAGAAQVPLRAAR